RRRDSVVHLQITRDERNRRRAILFHLEKSFVGAAEKLLHLDRIGLQRRISDEDAALQLDQVLFRKSDQLAKSAFLRLESYRRRKNGGIDDAALQHGKYLRHHTQNQHRDVAIAAEAVQAQHLAQQRIRPAADAVHADPFAFQRLHVANFRLGVEPEHRAVVSSEEKLERRAAQERRQTGAADGGDQHIAAEQRAAGE